MLGASDRPDDGLDFLFLCNPFVHAKAVDAEHMIRRALLGNVHTVVSMTGQDGMNGDVMLERYAHAGLSLGNVFGNTPPEMGMPDKGFKCTY